MGLSYVKSILRLKIRNWFKEYIKDEVPKALVSIYGQDSPLQENFEYKGGFNNLYFLSKLKEDADFITTLGT